MKLKWLLSTVIAILFLTGCGDKEYNPKEISAETDVCEVCNMTIAHMDYAGQIVFKNNDHLVFDGLEDGCDHVQCGAFDHLDHVANRQDHVKTGTPVASSDRRFQCGCQRKTLRDPFDQSQ